LFVRNVAVAADDDARPEAVLDTASRAEEIVGAPEELRERIDHAAPDDLLCGDVDHRGYRAFGDAREIDSVVPFEHRSRPDGTRRRRFPVETARLRSEWVSEASGHHDAGR
jgi:hypothetical protein